MSSTESSTTKEAQPRFLYFTEKGDDNEDVLCINYKAKGEHLTIGELAAVLNTLLKNHPELASSAVNSAYEEWGNTIEVKSSSGLLIE